MIEREVECAAYGFSAAEVQAREVQTVRRILDRKTGTPVQRLSHLLQFYQEQQGPPTPDDPLTQLRPNFPVDKELDVWTGRNMDHILKLQKENPRDWMTEASDVYDNAKPFAESWWLQTADRFKHLVPFETETQLAAIAMRLLYLEADA